MKKKEETKEKTVIYQELKTETLLTGQAEPTYNRKKIKTQNILILRETQKK